MNMDCFWPEFIKGLSIVLPLFVYSGGGMWIAMRLATWKHRYKVPLSITVGLIYIIGLVAFIVALNCLTQAQ